MSKHVLTSALGATGASLGAGLAALCCVAPAAFASLGMVGAVVAALAGVVVEFEVYRPYMLMASAALLAYGYWIAYFRKPKTAEAAVCSLKAGRLARVVLWVATVVTASAVAAPHFILRYLVL